MLNYNLEVIRSKKRKKTVSIKVINSHVIVLAPENYTDEQVAELLQTKTNWLKEKLNQKFITHLTYGMQIPLQEMIITIVECDNKNSHNISLVSDKLFIPKKLLTKEDLYAFFLEQALEKIPKRVNELSKSLNITFNRLKVKDLKRRWGSCSSLKNINLSWRLILLPNIIMDYVIIHELCHLTIMNHSREFWSLVEKRFPQYHAAENYLKNLSQDQLALLEYFNS